MSSHHIPYSELTILREIGQGGNGTIFLAEWNKNNVAVKKCNNTIARDDLIKEANILAKLDHNHIVRLKGTSKDPDTNVLLIMEYFENGSLDALLTRRSLYRAEVIQIALDIVNGLLYLHLEKVIHRDLTSPNVLLYDGERRAKISDFGTARNVHSTTHPITVLGTLGFIAPEILAEKLYNAQVDVFSFGAVLYHMLSRTKISVLSEDERVNKIRSTITDPDFQELIVCCCRTDPILRPSTQECKKVLKKIKKGQDVQQLLAQLKSRVASADPAPSVTSAVPPPLTSNNNSTSSNSQTQVQIPNANHHAPSFLDMIGRAFSGGGSLIGTWQVQCPYCKRVDTVKDVTRYHTCTNPACGQETKVNDGFDVKCTNPNCTQVDHVDGITAKHKCSKCGNNMP